MKKILSLLLVLATVFSLMAGMSISSNAATNVWEREPNNEEFQANDFKIGQTMNANLTDIFDYDFFRVKIDTNVKFKLKFEHEYPYRANYDYWEVDIDRYDPSTGEYRNCTGMTVGDFESTRWTEVINARAGEKFMISVYENNGASTLDYKMTLEPVISISKVSGLKCKARTDSSITVTWNKMSGVSGYQIQTCTKDGKKWSTYATLGAGTNTYTFKKLASGNNYKFRCRAFIKDSSGNTTYGSWCGTINAPTLPKGMTLSKLTAAKKAFTAQWKKQSGVTGYQIQYSTSSKFTNAKYVTVKNVKTLKATAKNLSAKKTYYVRVRTYKTINKSNYCSTWSKTYKVKTK